MPLPCYQVNMLASFISAAVAAAAAKNSSHLQYLYIHGKEVEPVSILYMLILPATNASHSYTTAAAAFAAAAVRSVTLEQTIYKHCRC